MRYDYRRNFSYAGSREKNLLSEKGRKTEQPNAHALYNDWNPNKHEIVIDEEKYPKIKITTQPEKRITDPTTRKEYVEPAVRKEVDPNRLLFLSSRTS